MRMGGVNSRSIIRSSPAQLLSTVIVISAFSFAAGAVSTYKLVILFRQADDLDELRRRWSEEFVPLAERLPGLRRIVVSHVHGGPAGAADFTLIHELHFDSLMALTSAMAAPEGVAAGQCLVRLARDNATLLFAEHQEDIPRPGP